MASFEFFRKHQRLILYTAGIFALLTFSITGAMTAFFDQFRGGGYRGAALTMADGRRTYVQLEDHRVAQALVNTERNFLPQLIPPIGGAKTSEGDRVELLAAARRLAIEYGIGGSLTEGREAMKHIVDVWPKRDGSPPVTAADVQRQTGLSGDQYELLLRESVRISNFLRMFAFAADTSDAQLAEKLARDIKLLTFEVATLDKKLVEDKLKQTEVSDDDLKAWLEQLPDAEKVEYQDTNRLAIKAAGVKLADFDPALFAAELKDQQHDDKAIEARYTRDRDLYHRREKKEGEPVPDDPYLPLAEVKAAVLARMQAEAALQVVLGKVREQLGEAVRPAVDARNAASKDLASKRAALVEADRKLAEKPDDEAAKTAAAEAKTQVEAAEKAHQDAEAAVETARRAFDFEAALGKATTAKLTLTTIPEPGNADRLKEIAEFGPWDDSWSAASMDLPGDVCGKVQNTKTAVFLFQVLDVVKTPLKEFATIKDKLKENYYKKKADEQAKTTLTAFEGALDRLAREAKKTEIEQLEAEFTAEVNRKFDDWKKNADAELAKAKERRDALSHDMGSLPYKRWSERFQQLEQELADADNKRKSIEAEARKATDEKIAKMVKAARKDVLPAAAAEAGLTVETLGPVRKDADAQPRFQDDRPARERFLLANPAVKQLAEGDASDVLEDATNRAHHLVVMRKIEPGTVDLVTRRELVNARNQFERERAAQAVSQSFSLDALMRGWGYLREGAPVENKAAKTGGAKASSDKAADGKTAGDKPAEPKTGGDQPGNGK